MLARAWSLDSVGPLARTARDCARLTRVIAGGDPKDPTCSTQPVPNYEKTLESSVKGLRIGVPTNYYYDGATPDVKQCMEASLTVLKFLGARLVELAVPDPQAIHRVSSTVSQCEAAALHARWSSGRRTIRCT